MKKLFTRVRLKGKKNRAFSLVEVLCAIVLLAIVATPILQAIVAGMNLNVKSRKLLGAADLTAGTMEFISSLTFEDYTYTSTVDSNTYTVKGYKSYYWSCGASNGAPVYPHGPLGDFTAATGSATSKTVVINNVDYDGFKYTMTIKCTKPTTTDTYYAYNVVVDVCENGTTNVLSTAKTSIMNQY